MSEVNFQRTYQLRDEYETIKERAEQVLGNYLEYPDLITFRDVNRSVIFKSERLIPTVSTNRPRIIFLFSNPHPHSVHQGMFLSPNIKGGENPFWSTMRDAGWISFTQEITGPEQLADLCLRARYDGPFEFVFYCYYAFPTRYPKDIKKIFGRKYFNQEIEPEDRENFRRTIEESGVQAVVTFNKGIFNQVSRDPVKRYIDNLVRNELVHSRVKAVDVEIPIYLT
ncbi:MAG: hypothetical protein GWN30_03360, partial [Gammaproteobacteria bacterium]|nr:hypothetical protein [Gammaproteobacteria bacterium]